jgi:hypothetical protein
MTIASDTVNKPRLNEYAVYTVSFTLHNGIPDGGAIRVAWDAAKAKLRSEPGIGFICTLHRTGTDFKSGTCFADYNDNAWEV